MKYGTVIHVPHQENGNVGVLRNFLGEYYTAWYSISGTLLCISYLYIVQGRRKDFEGG